MWLKIRKVKVVAPSPFYDGKYHPPLAEQLSLFISIPESYRKKIRTRHAAAGFFAHFRHFLDYKCSLLFFSINCSTVSSYISSGTQQSTGHTAAHWGSSWKPWHSVHLFGVM